MSTRSWGTSLVSTLSRLVRTLPCSLRLRIDLGDPSLVGTRSLLRFLDGLRQRFDLSVHFSDLRSHHLLGCTGGGSAECKRKDRRSDYQLLHLCLRASIPE